jgi:putative addiction module killer protein
MVEVRRSLPGALSGWRPEIPAMSSRSAQALSELRIAFGPGYRVYFKLYGDVLILRLAGGDKSSQAADIAVAKAIAEDWEVQ